MDQDFNTKVVHKKGCYSQVGITSINEPNLKIIGFGIFRKGLKQKLP